MQAVFTLLSLKTMEIYGVDILSFTFKAIHALMAAAWLILDFVVFWLHFKIKNPDASLEERLERARIMHGIDTVVAYIFILMLPGGIILSFVTVSELFTTGWLSWKHVLYGIIILDAFYLLPISGTALRNLKAIKEGGDEKLLNKEITDSMNKAMPAVWLIWFLVILASLISVLNLKVPQGQKYIFRSVAESTSFN